MSFPSPFFLSPPDPASRQPFTTAAFLPLYSLYYVLAVLAILPRTFILKLALLPIFLWQVWKCTTGFDLAAGLANSLGLESTDRVLPFNFGFVVRFLWSWRAPSPFPLTVHYAGRVVRYGAQGRLLDVRWEAAQKVQTTRGGGPRRCPHRAPLVHPERSPRRTRSYMQSARNRMVVVVQAIPHHEHPFHIHPRHPSQTAHQARSVRRLALHRAVSPTLRQHSCWRHPLRPSPKHGPALRLGNFLHSMRRHGGVLDRRRVLPRLNARGSHPPPTSDLAMATALRPSMGIHLNHGLLGLPLASTFPARVRRLRLAARLGALRSVRSGCGRFRGVWVDARRRDVGSWKGHGIFHRWRILPSHGRWRGLGTWVQTGDWPSCGWTLGLGMDYGVDCYLGHFDD